MTLAPILALALAGEPATGVALRIEVSDPEGLPIPTAVIRHPLEQDRHRVNAVDGSWQGDVFYLPDGRELRFVPGENLELEISAPGYLTQRLTWEVRKKKLNRVEVELLVLVLSDEPIEEPPIRFGRDEPLDGAEGG